jgi:hypothetical protein
MLPSSLRALPPVGRILRSTLSSRHHTAVELLAIARSISLSCCRRVWALPPVGRILRSTLHDLLMLPEPLALPPVMTPAICPFMISPSCCRRGFFRLLADSAFTRLCSNALFNRSNSTTFYIPWLQCSSFGLGAIGEQENPQLVHDSRSSLRSLSQQEAGRRTEAVPT